MLEAVGLASAPYFRDVSFAISAGEIVGLGGIQGNGQREIARALYGLLPVSGELKLNGSPVSLRSPSDAIRVGVIYVPADRRGESLFGQHSVSKNIAAPHLPVWSRFGVLDQSREKRAVSDIIRRFTVRTPSAGTAGRLFERWQSTESRGWALAIGPPETLYLR